MSSITDRRTERGQVLAIFAFGIVGILAIAALVFDVGSNLFERRKHQDAADSAALAGARFLATTTDSISGMDCRAQSNKAACRQAVQAAESIMTMHGYDLANVDIHIPPLAVNTQFGGRRGHIEVSVRSDRGSFFAGLLGLPAFRISATAVAANIQSYALPYSFLSLDPHSCKAGHLHGNGVMTIEGDVQVASDCTQPGAFSFDGNNVQVNVTGTCSTSGSIDYGPSSTVSCGATTEGVPPVSDPLAGLGRPAIGTPAVPSPPAAPITVTGTVQKTGCPGGAGAATEANPVGCTLNAQGASAGSVRIFPGVYWGGINLSPNRDLTVYMEPGIYYMAGGGFEVAGSHITLRTVDAGTTTTGGGVMVWNDDVPAYRSQCASGAGLPAGSPCIASIDFQNTNVGAVELYPYQGSVYGGMLFVQDRDASSQPAFKLTGNSNSGLHGTIYLPKAAFEFQGNGTASVLNAQVIAWTFDVGGNGDLLVTYVPEDAVQLRGIGLVQ